MARLFTVIALTSAAACAASNQIVFTADELRSELARRLPDVPRDELVVPFELDPSQEQQARRLGQYLTLKIQRAEALLDALRNSDDLSLEYVPAATATAAETLAARQGNCLSLASAVVGMARAAGLEAYYVDVSHRVEDVVQHRDLMVRSGHVLGIIRTRDGFAALDIAGRDLRAYGAWHTMSDLEAVAHFHNNRGYDLIFFSGERGLPVPWQLVYEQFRRATLIQPDFARAWNNLGVAAARLGRVGEAEAAYRVAASHAPRLPSPYANLGALFLGQGRYQEAEPLLRRALELDEQAEVAASLGRVLHALGRQREAVEILERAVELGSEVAAQQLERINGPR